MSLRKIIRLSFISIFIALVISGINFLQEDSIQTWTQELEEFGVNFMFSLVLTLVNHWYFDVINLRYSWINDTAKRITYGAIGSIVLTMISLFVLYFVTIVFIYGFSVDYFIKTLRWETYIFGLLFTIVVSVIFHAFYFYKEVQSQKVKEQKVIARNATAQFDALKNQLDPHFLFNSLNVLVSLIEENPKTATKFTTSLSKIYRYVLEQRNKELVSIDEEYDFARLYISLLKTRFEDSIEVQIPERSSNPEARVVPLCLQLLLENAVKHNVISDSQPLRLRIYEQDNQLIVENNLQKKQVTKTSSGVGLQNIASRYQLLTNRKMSISQDTSVFKVQLPILTTQPEVVNLKPDTMSTVEDIKLIKAKARVANIKEFYDSALKTIGIITFLGVINFFTSDFPWVIFPAAGMSIGLFIQYVKNYNKDFFLGNQWEERMIKKYMDDKNF